jgi:hypothetical protein
MSRAGHLTRSLCLTIEEIRSRGSFIYDTAGLLISTLVTVNDDNTVFIPLLNCLIGAYKGAHRFGTVIAGRSYMADKKRWELSLLTV